MKRIAVLPLLLCLAAVPTVASPVRLVSDDAAGAVFEVRTERPRLVPVTRDGERYQSLSIADWPEETPTPGRPVVPSLPLQLYVPSGTTVAIEPLRIDRAKEIPLARDLAFADRIPVHDGRAHFVKKDEAAYRATYGESVAEIEADGWSSHEHLTTVRLWPVRYDAARRTLRWTPFFRVRFRYDPVRSKGPARPVIGENGTGVARYVVANPAVVPVPAPTRGSRIDLVIAHESYREALIRLVQFKKMSGRRVREHYVSDKSAEEIQTIIRDEYKRNEAPSHTLLVGNIDQIPAWRGSSDNRQTDFPYQKLDDDDVPDISVGRIPAHTAEELSAFIDKMIGREIEPRNVGEILVTAGRDTSMGCPQNVTRVGDELKKGGDDVNVTQKFKTQVSTQEILDAYNDNPNLIVYDGHGDRQGMTEVPLLISDLDKLTNKAFPIILDIACLNANWGSSASPRNFAESILLRPGKGAAGIMASGGSGFGHDFFRSIGSIMAEARKNIGHDTKMNEIGQVILAAKVKNTQQDRSYWNYYGDPASSVWEPTLGAR